MSDTIKKDETSGFQPWWSIFASGAKFMVDILGMGVGIGIGLYGMGIITKDTYKWLKDYNPLNDSLFG